MEVDDHFYYLTRTKKFTAKLRKLSIRCVTETISKRQKSLLHSQFDDHCKMTTQLTPTTLVEYGESNAFLSTTHNLLRESMRQIKVAVEVRIFPSMWLVAIFLSMRSQVNLFCKSIPICYRIFTRKRILTKSCILMSCMMKSQFICLK